MAIPFLFNKIKKDTISKVNARADADRLQKQVDEMSAAQAQQKDAAKKAAVLGTPAPSSGFSGSGNTARQFLMSA